VTGIKEAKVPPKVTAKPKHHKAVAWQDVAACYADFSGRSTMAARALMFASLTGPRNS
jgi:hypothetical protein